MRVISEPLVRVKHRGAEDEFFCWWSLKVIGTVDLELAVRRVTNQRPFLVVPDYLGLSKTLQPTLHQYCDLAHKI